MRHLLALDNFCRSEETGLRNGGNATNDEKPRKSETDDSIARAIVKNLPEVAAAIRTENDDAIRRRKTYWRCRPVNGE